MNGMALCAGVGGLERALALVENHRTVLWCEWDKRAAATLVSNFGEGLDVAPIWDDLRSLDGKPWRGVVDLISAGFPCQPFSDAGNKRGEDDPRHLWPHVLRITREVDPEYVFLENVPGIVTTYPADGRPAAIVVREDLEELGFRVEEGLFSAEEVGAPQRRVRWFLVAHHNRHLRQGGHGLGDRHSDSGAGRADAGRGIPVAYSDGTSAGQGGKQQPQLVSAPRPSAKLAHSDRGRYVKRLPGGESAVQQPRQAGGTMADPGSERPQGERRGRPAARPARRSRGTEVADTNRGRARTRIHPFPPARDADWTEYLERYPYAAPATESSVRGDPDGVASGMDVCLCSRRARLKQCGNGVVPATAALAWTTLKARIR